jgi:hypothetical protein
LEEATLQHLHDLKQPLTGVVLQDPRKPDAKLAAAIVEVFGRDAGEVYTAKLARIHSRAVCNGDVVAFDHDGRRRFGQVFSCFCQWAPAFMCVAVGHNRGARPHGQVHRSGCSNRVGIEPNF